MSKANVGRRNLDSYRWWTKQDDGQLTELYGTHKLKDIAEIMGRSVSSVANRRVKLGLKRTPEQQAKIGDGCFKPGQKPWNTGKKGWKAGGRSAETQFKKGEKPSNTWRPIGAERVSKDGLLQRKVSDTGDKRIDWRPVHVLIWEAENGPVPEGHIVVFKDRDQRNLSPDNLEAITRAENMRRNSIDRYPPEYRQAAITLGWFKRRINKVEQGQHENNR